MSKNGFEVLDVIFDELEQVVVWCIENCYFDDNCFVGQFIVSWSCKGYGLVCICQEFSQKGIVCQVVDQVMCECDIDWVSFVREQVQCKYGELLFFVFIEKVKVQ